jgi:C-terminal processing protease CtpA/Prc
MEKNGKKKKALRIIGAVAVVASMAGGVTMFVRSGHSRSGPPQRDMKVDAATRASVVEGVISNLNQAYVFPEAAAEIENGLRLQMRRNELDSTTSAEALADELTIRLRKLARGDQHLEVRYIEQPIPPPTKDDEPSPDEKAAQLAMQRRLNGGLETVGRLHGNLGYLEIRKFWRPQFVAPKLPAAMKLVADTDALIIDLRDCGGGDPETVMLFASYFFDHPTHLNDIYWRDENRTEERWTTDAVSGERYGEKRRLYVLTSSETISGCEDLAYALKNAGRATVIGEVTAGAAHAGGPKRVSEHFMMFVPSGRPVSPVTHTDWEGVGVAPDVKTSAKNALVVAQIEALKQLAAVEADAAWKEKLEHTIADLN